MTRPTFYIDLDRTLFRTEKANEIVEAIAKHYPGNQHIQQGYEQRGDYYVFPGAKDDDGAADVAYYHDFKAQLQHAGINCSEAFATVKGELADGRFEYPGSQQLIEFLRARGEVVILTYGEDVYQRFKAELCPSLEDVPVVTIVESKSAYLNHHAKIEDWIIDDKIMVGLSNGMHVIRIQHTDEVPADAHSLEDVALIVKQQC